MTICTSSGAIPGFAGVWVLSVPIASYEWVTGASSRVTVTLVFNPAFFLLWNTMELWLPFTTTSLLLSTRSNTVSAPLCEACVTSSQVGLLSTSTPSGQVIFTCVRLSVIRYTLASRVSGSKSLGLDEVPFGAFGGCCVSMGLGTDNASIKRMLSEPSVRLRKRNVVRG